MYSKNLISMHMEDTIKEMPLSFLYPKYDAMAVGTGSRY